MQAELKQFREFLEEVWREVRPDKGRVAWPTMKSIRMGTVLVMFSSIVLSVYIFFCDSILQQVIKMTLRFSK